MEKVRDFWFLMVMNNHTQGILTESREVEVKLEGMCPTEIWCCGAVPEEIVDLCRIRLMPRGGNLIVCPIGWREGGAKK